MRIEMSAELLQNGVLRLAYVSASLVNPERNGQASSNDTSFLALGMSGDTLRGWDRHSSSVYSRNCGADIGDIRCTQNRGWGWVRRKMSGLTGFAARTRCFAAEMRAAAPLLGFKHQQVRERGWLQLVKARLRHLHIALLLLSQHARILTPQPRRTILMRDIRILAALRFDQPVWFIL